MRSQAHTPRRRFLPQFAGLLVAFLTAHLAPAATAERHPARSPEEALKLFQLEAGLRIELVASEPS